MATSEHRDNLGRLVRDAWVKWALTQPSPKPSWLVPYNELSEPDKEADRQIGEALFAAGFDAGQNAPDAIVASRKNVHFFQCEECGLDACVIGVSSHGEAKRLLMNQEGWNLKGWLSYCGDCEEQRRDERERLWFNQ